ncbi:MAG: type II toxin-antitoxin system VapB family antitoxin [Dermatophilaceae bacterium]
MPDVLIRNFPAEDLTVLDDHAARLGISRTEYLRRHLHREAQRVAARVTADDLRGISALLPDLGDESVMGAAWA